MTDVIHHLLVQRTSWCIYQFIYHDGTGLLFRYTQFSEFQRGENPSSGHKHTPPVTRVMIEKEQMTQKQ